MRGDESRHDRLRGVYAILDADTYGAGIIEAAAALIAGGVRIFQYRAKGGVDTAVLLRLHAMSAAADAVLLVNDDYEAAEHADGLHVGQDDLDDAALARYRARRPTGIVGISAHMAAHLLDGPGVAYFGVGPVRPTASKAHARPPLGIDGVARLARATERPVCAIGGVVREDFPALRAAGCAMAACIGAFAKAADPRATAAAYVRAWRDACPSA